MLVLVLLPKDGKSPVGALLKPKKILARVEFRKMLADLQSWRSKTMQIASLEVDPAEIVSNNYIDKIGKKEDFVDYLTVWKKRLKKLEIKSYTLRAIKQKSRLNIKFVGFDKKSSWTKCLDILISNQKQVLAYENRDCSQNFFASLAP